MFRAYFAMLWVNVGYFYHNQSGLYILSHLRGGKYLPHFTHEEIRVQRGNAIIQRSHSKCLEEPGKEVRSVLVQTLTQPPHVPSDNQNITLSSVYSHLNLLCLEGPTPPPSASASSPSLRPTRNTALGYNCRLVPVNFGQVNTHL